MAMERPCHCPVTLLHPTTTFPTDASSLRTWQITRLELAPLISHLQHIFILLKV